MARRFSILIAALSVINATLAAEQEAAVPPELTSYIVQRDDFQGVTFILPPYERHGDLRFEAYIVDPAQPRIRLVIDYLGEDWLFCRRAIFLVGEQRFVITGDWKTKVEEHGAVRERIDIPVRSVELDFLLACRTAIMEGTPIRVRLDGDDGNLDLVLSARQRSLLLATLALYYDPTLAKHVPGYH